VVANVFQYEVKFNSIDNLKTSNTKKNKSFILLCHLHADTGMGERCTGASKSARALKCLLACSTITYIDLLRRRACAAAVKTGCYVRLITLATVRYTRITEGLKSLNGFMLSDGLERVLLYPFVAQQRNGGGLRGAEKDKIVEF
jgi:hypothetical protein